MKFIVTAGGQGTKIWPMSRVAIPKQFQSIVGDIPPYQQTIKTLLKEYKPEDIFISTKKRYVDLCKELSPEIPGQNYIIEPDISKDRGPAEGLAFVTLSLLHPDEVFMIVQSDCLREPEEGFLLTIKKAEELVKKTKKYVTGGIKATYPIIGVDYLQLGDKVSTDDGVDIYKTDKFIKRNDDYQKTKELVSQFTTATHSNHSAWYPDLILNAYAQYRPDWYQSLMKIKELLLKKQTGSEIDQIYSEMEAGPTELVTENVFTDGYTILLPYKWTDIGTWDSVYEFFDTNGNVYSDANSIALNAKKSIIKSTNKKRLIAVNDISDLVIIDTEDVLLITRRDNSNAVKELLSEIKKNKLDQYL